jgi:hypothetical protein
LATVSKASVLIDGKPVRLTEGSPLVFGRANSDRVVGLDSRDMGISAMAGSVERDLGLWWVVNRSRKRKLLLDLGGTSPQPLECGQRFAIALPRLVVLVPGAVFTHRIEIRIPEHQLARVAINSSSSGTVTAGQILLSDRDREALVALLGGYLEDFPRRQSRPRTYQQAADLLGPPWTKVKVRKQIERLKERLARAGVFFDGPQANFDLADHLVGEGVLSHADLVLLKTSV